MKTPLRGKALTMTEEDTNRMRATVSDNPVTLPKGALACEWCGVAVPGGKVAATISQDDRFIPEDSPNPRRTMGTWREPLKVSRCSDCQTLVDRVQASGTAWTDRLMCTLVALDLLGLDLPAEPQTARLLVKHLWIQGRGLAFRRERQCSPYRFAHVSMGMRAEVRKSYLNALRERVQGGAPVRPDAPPEGTVGCAYCGVGEAKSWRPITATASALGRRGGGTRIKGYLCSSCAACRDSVGSVGYSSMLRALTRHLENTPEGERVRTLLAEGNDLTGLVGWAALGQEQPNATAWAHLVVPEVPTERVVP